MYQAIQVLGDVNVGCSIGIIRAISTFYFSICSPSPITAKPRKFSA